VFNGDLGLIESVNRIEQGWRAARRDDYDESEG
jgi:hypothetical protein